MKDINLFILEKLQINKDTKIIKSDPDDPTTWSTGDILVTSGGYNMTLVYFYKIIKCLGKSFIVRELKKNNISGGGMRGECVPIEDEFDPREKELRVRITKYNRIKIDDHYASLWDGKPVYYDHMD